MVDLSKLSLDELKALDKAIQTMTDAHVKQVDALVKGKQDELVKV
jgi:ribosome recycling factor